MTEDDTRLKEATPWYLDQLICPDCAGDFRIEGIELQCSECGYETRLDFPLLLAPIDPVPLAVAQSRLEPIAPHDFLRRVDISQPTITYEGPSPIRDSREFLSEMVRGAPPPGDVLDLGCGPRDQFVPINHLGYRYVGIDRGNEAADIQADAHALPFRADSFDCVLAYAVFEHLFNPFVAIREIERVLRPSGVFVGAVSQGEPFHSSYFHHTPWGLLSLISTTGSLKLVRVWGSVDTLDSLARMGRYPRVLKWLLKALDTSHRRLPLLAPRRLSWSAEEQALDRLYRAGSVCFTVVKSPVANLERTKPDNDLIKSIRERRT